MMGPSRRVAVLAAITAGACSAGDNTVDPGDLELRDLLGLSPDVAVAWTAGQRSAARRVLIAGLDTDDEPSRTAIDPAAIDLDDAVVAVLAAGDARRTAEGAEPLGLVRLEV